MTTPSSPPPVPSPATTPASLPVSWWAAARWLGIDDETAARVYAERPPTQEDR